jgi:hypothetical protein
MIIIVEGSWFAVVNFRGESGRISWIGNSVSDRGRVTFDPCDVQVIWGRACVCGPVLCGFVSLAFLIRVVVYWE